MRQSYLSLILCSLGLVSLWAVPRTSPADPTAVPTEAPALSADDKALIAKVNSLYYNYKKLGLHKFKCEVKVDMFDNILKSFESQMKPDDKSLKALKDVRFFITYDETNGYGFNYTNYVPTGDAATDAKLSRILQGVSQIIQGFWSTWESVTFEPAVDTVKNTVTVKKTGTGYEIDEKNGTTQVANIFDADLLMTEGDVTNTAKPDAKATLKPLFTKTTDGLLVTSVSSNVSNFMSATLGITYQTVKNFQMPSTADFQMTQLGSINMNASIQFLNYQVN